MTDNALSYWNVHYYHSVLNDSYDATNHYFATTYWTNDLKGIRCYQPIYEKNARAKCYRKCYKERNDKQLYTVILQRLASYIAILHFDMCAWFGAIPIIGNDADGLPIVFGPEDIRVWNMSRTSSAEANRSGLPTVRCCKDVLPFRYANENENWGRMNGAAAYVPGNLELLLYRASALTTRVVIKRIGKEAAGCN